MAIGYFHLTDVDSLPLRMRDWHSLFRGFSARNTWSQLTVLLNSTVFLWSKRHVFFDGKKILNRTCSFSLSQILASINCYAEMNSLTWLDTMASPFFANLQFFTELILSNNVFLQISLYCDSNTKHKNGCFKKTQTRASDIFISVHFIRLAEFQSK